LVLSESKNNLCEIDRPFGGGSQGIFSKIFAFAETGSVGARSFHRFFGRLCGLCGGSYRRTPVRRYERERFKKLLSPCGHVFVLYWFDSFELWPPVPYL
jgi:hypothetical protein